MSNFDTPLTQNAVSKPRNDPKVAALLGVLIVLAPFLLMGVIGERLGDGTTAGAVFINVGYAISVIVATVVLIQRRSGWDKIGLAWPTSWLKTVLLAVGTVFIYIIVVNIALPALLQLLPAIPQADRSSFNPLSNNLPLLFLYLTAAWTTIAFGEEMLFRAFLMDSLAMFFKHSRARWGLALAGSSILFGLAHFSWGLAGVIETTVMGFVLGFVFLRTGRNLWVTVIAHALLNTLMFVLIYSGLI